LGLGLGLGVLVETEIVFSNGTRAQA